MQVYLSEHIAPSAYARLARHFEIVTISTTPSSSPP